MRQPDRTPWYTPALRRFDLFDSVLRIERLTHSRSNCLKRSILNVMKREIDLTDASDVCCQWQKCLIPGTAMKAPLLPAHAFDLQKAIDGLG